METSGDVASRLMTAVVANEHGGPLRVTQVARPVPGHGEVLVRIAASGVNPLDTKKFMLVSRPMPAIHYRPFLAWTSPVS